MRYGFNNIQPSSKEDLNQYVSDEEIIEHYHGTFQIGKMIQSPFRHDPTPSFHFIYLSGKLKYVDFGDGFMSHDAIDFVKNSLPNNPSYSETLRVIYNDLVLNSGKIRPDKPIKSYLETKKRDIGIRYKKKYEDWEYEYWRFLGVTERKLMDRYKIFPCEVWIDKKRVQISKKGDPVYLYLFDKDRSIWKSYKPFNKDRNSRFLSNNIANHIQGWDLLPESGEIVFVTKSYKDVVVFECMGFPACAPHNEGIFLPEDLIVDLKKRFKHVYVNYDNDYTGVTKSQEYTAKYDLKYWNVPKSCGDCKDPFDMVKSYGFEYVLENINEKFKRDGL